MPNAGHELLPEAGARDERTLEAVSSMPLLDLHLPLPPWFGFALGRRSHRTRGCALDAMGLLPADGLHADD